MEKLRKSFFIAATAIAFVVILVEVGSSLLGEAGNEVSVSQLRRVAEDLDMGEAIDQIDGPDVRRVSENENPPGLAIGYLALVDGLLLFNILLVAISLFLRERVQARLQGILTLIFSLLIIIGGIGLIFFAFGMLMLMIALLTAAPFGTIAYFAIYGFFDRPDASALLGLLMVLKIGFVVCLVLAHQRFMQNKGLVFLILTSFLCGVIVSFLHAFVPLFLVSITDAVAAIIVAIIAVIWAIVLLLGSLKSIMKALRLDRV
jgi:hypothetical protein